MSVSRDFAKLPRGTHAFAWQPPGRGRYRVRIEARGPSGPVGVETRTVRIKTAAKPKKTKKRQAAGEAQAGRSGDEKPVRRAASPDALNATSRPELAVT